MYAVELKPPNILATGVGRPRNGLRRLEVHPEETASNKREASRRNSNRGESRPVQRTNTYAYTDETR